MYKYARASTSDQAQQSGEALYKIISVNSDSLSFEISSVNNLNYTIEFKDGFPVFVERLEALFYLPPEAVSQSLAGNLDWINQLETSAGGDAVNYTSEAVEYTVEAGTFQCLNLTLQVVGFDYGSLNYLFDVDSGIVVYQLWVPSYGDIIMQQLSSTDYVQVAGQSLFVSVLSAVFPGLMLFLSMFFGVTLLRRRKPKSDMGNQDQMVTLKPPLIRSGFPKKPFVLMVVGALVSLISVFLPWSQINDVGTFLPVSLIPLVDQSSWLLPLNTSFMMLTVGVYCAVLLAWTSLIIHVYREKKLLPQILVLLSSIVGFLCVGLFYMTGWTLSFGGFVLLAGSVLSLIGLAVANIHISVKLESEEEDFDALNEVSTDGPEVGAESD